MNVGSLTFLLHATFIFQSILITLQKLTVNHHTQIFYFLFFVINKYLMHFYLNQGVGVFSQEH